MKNCTLALDAGGTYLKCGLFLGAQLVEGSLDSERVNSNGTYEEVGRAYYALLDRVSGFATSNSLNIAEVSIDTPGPFDFKNGISRMAHKYLAIKDQPIAPLITARLGDIPVRFMHDSAAFIQGAAAQLGEKGFTRYAGVMIGTGLGFALMIDGEVLRNENGGPLRSIYAQPYRGGIAEDVISGRGIVNAYNAKAAKPLQSAKEIGDLAEVGDSLAIEVYRVMAVSLAEIISPILAEYGIEALLLGGQISKSFNIFGDTLRESLSSVTTLRHISHAPDIDMAHLIGAAVGH